MVVCLVLVVVVVVMVVKAMEDLLHVLPSLVVPPPLYHPPIFACPQTPSPPPVPVHHLQGCSVHTQGFQEVAHEVVLHLVVDHHLVVELVQG